MPLSADSKAEELDSHLSQISTLWSAFAQAHAGPVELAQAAFREILARYQRAIYRYLLGSVRDADAADELFQEFALRLVRGDFQRADPERGRLRDFFKTSLYHLIVDHHRRRGRQALALPEDVPQSTGDNAPDIESDARFLAAWKLELMNRAWEALAREERITGHTLHGVLRYRTDHPEATSDAMAEHFTRVLGKPLTAGWVRKRLFVAREKFTDLLLDEVARSLADSSSDRLADELTELGLLEYCKAALARRTS